MTACMIDTLYKVHQMKIGRGAEFLNICKIENFAKCTESSQTQGIGHQKYPTYVHVVPRVPHYQLFRSTINHFQDTNNFTF